MKTAILLISFGSSYRRARQSSLDRIFEELKEFSELYAANNGIQLVWHGQAYTSGKIIRKLAEENIFINTVEEGIEKARTSGAKALYAVVTHMIPGIEYEKIKRILNKYRTSFSKIVLTTPILNREEDCEELLPILKEIYQFREEEEYLLMGHGTTAEANCRYEQMNHALKAAGLSNVRIASVEAKPDLEDAIAELKQKESVKKVVLYPFMVVAGDHAVHDMAGEEDSYASVLKELGYEVEPHIQGLGEFPQFRQLYFDKLLQEEQTFMSGILYGVGVGPGDPELLTLKAVRILRESDVIGIPAADAKSCTAFSIAAAAVPELREKELLSVSVPMTKDLEKLAKAYALGCEKLAELLRQGKQIAFLNLGDPTIYGTYMELHSRIRNMGFAAEVVSGVPSFCAVAAALGEPLGARQEAIHILPGSYQQELNLPGTKILMKSGGTIAKVRQELIALQERENCQVLAVTNCTMEHQTISRTAESISETAGYFTTILIKDAEEK